MSKLLITGGTGSFGNSVVKRYLDNPEFSEIVIFSRDEKKQYDMLHFYNNPKLTYIIGDVRDKDSVSKACKGVDIIFHGAALKHVPTGESFPIELVKTNILGTENVLNAAEENGVKKVVFLTTDKAAYPINTMGMTKAIAEKLISAHALRSKSTVFCAVRYGNVMASRGSVIPLFIELIKAGKPLQVTDPLMTRFLLSLDDAIQLVELAIKEGKPGDLFIKKAPASTMADLAKALLNVFHAKNEIKIVGPRPGEKVHETLATQVEMSRAEDMGTHYRIHDMVLSKGKDFYGKEILEKIDGDYTSENTTRLSVPEIEKLLLSLDYVQEQLKDYKKSKEQK